MERSSYRTAWKPTAVGWSEYVLPGLTLTLGRNRSGGSGKIHEPVSKWTLGRKFRVKRVKNTCVDRQTLRLVVVEGTMKEKGVLLLCSAKVEWAGRVARVRSTNSKKRK